MSALIQDLKYGLRQLARNPGFAAVAVLTLALGIGANTAIFSVVNGLLFRPLPVRNPGQIYTLSAGIKGVGRSNGFSYQDLQAIRRQAGNVFSDVAGVQLFGVTGVSVGGNSQRMWTNFVTGNFFDMLGARPALGRLILPSEGSIAGADPVLVLGYSFWKAHFGGDPKIVGEKVLVDGRPVTVIGVAPKGFHSVSSFVDIQGYMPLGMAVIDHQIKADFLKDRRAKSMVLIARVKPKATRNEIDATMAVVAKRLAAEYPKADDWTNLHAFPLPSAGPTSSPSRSPLAVLSALFLTLAAVVFIVACLNVANILLARVTVRQHEMGIRAALGESRGRLIWRLLTESLLVALFGCVGGVALGLEGNRLLAGLPLHTSMPIVLDFHFDWRVFTYATAIALVAGAITGIVPALRTARGNLNEFLHSAGRTTAPEGHRFRKGLVVFQVGGSLTLLIVAGLFTRSLIKAQKSDLGFDPHHVLNITIDPGLAGYNRAQAHQFMENVLERTRALPGVRSASLAATVPMGNNGMGVTLEINGSSSSGQQAPFAGLNVVSPGYFETMGIPLLRGRAFRETDNRNSARVAVINQAMASRYWPGQNPLGKQFRLKGTPNHPVEVVGVVNNGRTDNLFEPEGPYFYMPLAQDPRMPLTLQARTEGNPESEAQGIIQLIKSLEPAMPLLDVQTMNEALGTLNGLLLFRWGAALAMVLGFLGLILTTVGLYGVVSYVTAQRTHEIGVRMAMGARPGQVLSMVLRQGFFIVMLGTVAGILGAFAIANLVGHFLVGVKPTDPLTFIAVSLVLVAVALAACYVPARRAAKVDPMEALRYE